jgi:GNAT superfamily N-acetyltransferase
LVGNTILLHLHPSAELFDDMSLEIRKAVRADATLILDLIKGIAEYEKLSHQVTATEEQILKTMFCEQPYAHCYLAFWNEDPVGYALYFFNFSTFLAKPGLYLEDLFVQPEMRGNGIGKELLLTLAREAKARDCGRMEWMALDWNTRAHDFYFSLGADMLEEWKLFRATGESLEKLAGL